MYEEGRRWNEEARYEENNCERFCCPHQGEKARQKGSCEEGGEEMSARVWVVRRTEDIAELRLRDISGGIWEAIEADYGKKAYDRIGEKMLLTGGPYRTAARFEPGDGRELVEWIDAIDTGKLIPKLIRCAGK